MVSRGERVECSAGNGEGQRDRLVGAAELERLHDALQFRLGPCLKFGERDKSADDIAQVIRISNSTFSCDQSVNLMSIG